MRVLLVEDDPALRDSLARVIREAAWSVDVVADGRGALAALGIAGYDVAIVDLALADTDKAEVCRSMRARGDRTSVLMLVAGEGVTDREQGLDLGADDYLTKPFEASELLARLQALSRRPPKALGPVLRMRDLWLDPSSHRVERDSTPVLLTAREFALLEYLLRNPRIVVRREQILEHVWHDAVEPVGNSVDVLVGRVRRKIDREGLLPLLHTVRGAGYVLAERPPSGHAR